MSNSYQQLCVLLYINKQCFRESHKITGHEGKGHEFEEYNFKFHSLDTSSKLLSKQNAHWQFYNSVFTTLNS